MRLIKITTSIFILISGFFIGWNNLFISTRSISVGAFSTIEVGGNIQVYLRPDQPDELIIRADNDVIEDVSVELRDEVLEICKNGCDNSSRVLEAYVSCKTLKSIKATGSSSITSRGAIEGADMNIEAKGSTELKIRLTLDTLKLIMKGAANVQLAGEVNHFNLLINDVGDLMAYNLVSQHCVARLNTISQSPGIARVNVNQTLNVKISGPRHLNFEGDATVIGKTINGGGKLNRL